jgi:hypothetical protein
MYRVGVQRSTFNVQRVAFGGTGGTPMILFAGSRGHARRRAHRIIGVSPVSPIPAKGADKARRQIFPQSRSQISSRHSATQAGRL